MAKVWEVCVIHMKLKIFYNNHESENKYLFFTSFSFSIVA